MLRLLADENFNGDIVRGPSLRRPALDIVRVQDVGLDGLLDPDILAWAANAQRILLTHDRATMSDFAYARVLAKESMPGAFILSDRCTVGKAIDEILLIDDCSEPAEWIGRVIHLPL